MLASTLCQCAKSAALHTLNGRWLSCSRYFLCRYLASRKPRPAEKTAQLRTTKVVGDTNVELATLSRQVYDLCRLQVASMLVMQKFPALTKLHSESQQDIIDDLDLKVCLHGAALLPCLCMYGSKV